MPNEFTCTSGIDTIPLSRWDNPVDGSISGIRRSRFFDPKVDRIDLQGHKIEDLVVVDAGYGILIHYIPKAWQVKLAEKYKSFDDFAFKEVKGVISRNYNDIVFWGTRIAAEGPERVHTFYSPEGSTADFVFLLSKSKTEQFKTWTNDRIIFLGTKRKKAASPQDGDEDAYPIATPTKFKIKNIDKITNFNPSTDTLEIDTDSFGIDSSATFASGKNKKEVKKKLAKQDFDILYDQKKGGLYFNENGPAKGFGDSGIIAILKGAPDLTADNLEFV